MELIGKLMAHWKEIAEIIAAIIGLASIIVKITPTLKDDNWWLPIVKFVGKYIALNKNTPTVVERKTGV